MRLKPECAGGDGRIDPGVLPPCGFIAAVMHLAMVSSAQGNGVLIADFASECPALGKSKVVGIRGSAAANQTRVLGNSFDVISVTNPAWLRQGQHALIDRLGSRAMLCLSCARSR